MKLKIMTFNVQHMRDYNFKHSDNIDMDKFAGYISSHGADIVGMNEVRGKGAVPEYDDQTDIVGEKAGYPYRYFARAIMVGGVNPYGNALLSHHEFTAETIAIPDPTEKEPDGRYFESRCVLKAEFCFGEKKLTVLTCHFGLNPSEAKNAVKTVCDIADSCKTPIVLMGDFNLTPDSPILDPIRTRFSDTEELLGEGKHYTYPSDGATMKIDYIFLKDAKGLSAKINNDIVSDHYSMETVIEL